MVLLRCRTCNKAILRYIGTRSKEYRLKAIRRHYKKHHPEKFKGFTKKALKTKREKHNPNGLGMTALTLASPIIIQLLKQAIDKINVGDYNFAKNIIKRVLEKITEGK